MSKKEKSIKEIEKQILDELGEEIRELRKQGKLYLFEKVMDHAMEKFKEAIKGRTEEEIEKYNNEGTLKKLSKMRTRNKSSCLPRFCTNRTLTNG